MTPRLQAILDKLRGKPTADTQDNSEVVRAVSVEETPALVLVPFFDQVQEDEFSPYF